MKEKALQVCIEFVVSDGTYSNLWHMTKGQQTNHCTRKILDNSTSLYFVYLYILKELGTLDLAPLLLASCYCIFLTLSVLSSGTINLGEEKALAHVLIHWNQTGYNTIHFYCSLQCKPISFENTFSSPVSLRRPGSTRLAHLSSSYWTCLYNLDVLHLVYFVLHKHSPSLASRLNHSCLSSPTHCTLLLDGPHIWL